MKTVFISISAGKVPINIGEKFMVKFGKDEWYVAKVVGKNKSGKAKIKYDSDAVEELVDLDEKATYKPLPGVTKHIRKMFSDRDARDFVKESQDAAKAKAPTKKVAVKAPAKKATPAEAPVKKTPAAALKPKRQDDGPRDPEPGEYLGGKMALIKYRGGSQWRYVYRSAGKSVMVDEGASDKVRPIDLKFVEKVRPATDAERKVVEDKNRAMHDKVETLDIKPGQMALIKFRDGASWKFIRRVNTDKGTFSIDGSGSKMRDLPINLVTQVRNASDAERQTADYQSDLMQKRKDKLADRRNATPFTLW